MNNETEKAGYSPTVHFLIGFCFGTIAYALVAASMETTHTTLAEVGVLKLAIVGSVPFICGALAVRLKGSFTQPLINMVNSLGHVLPF